MPARFLFLLGSARRDGNTELLARKAAASIPPDAEARWLRLAELPLEPFVDGRHGGEGHAMPAGHAHTLLQATLWCTDLVMVAPTYWYGLPAAAKLYLDHWSGWLRVPGLEFEARMAGVRLWTITVNSDEPGQTDGSALLVETLARSARYMGMHPAGALVGHGNRPGDVAGDGDAMAKAAAFFSSTGQPT